jgi:uncharacterized membrane protein
VLLASRSDRPVRAATAVGDVPPQAWADEIKAMQRSHQAGNMPAALKFVRGLLDARRTDVRVAVYVVSDFQAVDWMGRGESGATSDSSGEIAHAVGPAAALAGWAGRDRALEVLLVDVGRHVPSNRCIVNVHSEQSQSISGVVGRYLVRVANFGDEASRPGQLQVFMGDTALPSVPVPALAPNQTGEVPVELAFGQEGSQRLTVELEPDALPEDNARSCAVDVARALRLLLVNGEASADPYQDEAHLLNIALRPEGPEFSGNETTIINETELEVADLSNYHAVLLLNVNRVTEAMQNRLETYAAGGGGVVFFLGDQVDGNAYSRLLYRGGTGLLPAMLGDVSTAPAQQPGYRLEATDVDHPVIRKLGGTSATLLGGSLVWQWFDCAVPSSRPSTDGAPPLPDGRGSQSQPMERANAQVLLRLSDQQQSPILLERPFGRGRVLMCTTSADKEWNNLADQPVFVVLMLELMQHIARPAGSGGEQSVGQPIRMPLDVAAFEPGAVLKLPTYPSVPAMRIEARTNVDNGQSLLEWTDTSRPGLYTFELRRSGGETVVRQVAVNLDTRESDLRRAEKPALLASMGDLHPGYVTGETLENRAFGETRQELWPMLLAMVAALLMLEQGLAWWFGADRNWRRAFRRPMV